MLVALSYGCCEPLLPWVCESLCIAVPGDPMSIVYLSNKEVRNTCTTRSSVLDLPSQVKEIEIVATAPPVSIIEETENMLQAAPHSCYLLVGGLVSAVC